ncbi:MAG TPA: transglycosylase SLT domain-containing protein [Bacteroidales bacterium]|nr:transglycosylase SLT domain-containing protein [Bacteroidales bacterium]HRW94359.1 transglycosylase SLT domain-containing protein [Bacteroidales bacterium]
MSRKKFLIALLAAFVISFLYKEYYSRVTHSSSDMRTKREIIQAQNDTLRSTIYLPSHAGTRVGYHYEIMRRFSQSHDLSLKYIPANDTVSVWELLTEDKTDILAVNIIRDPIPKSLTGKLCITPKITPLGEVWVMMKSRCPWHLNLVHWLILFRQNPQHSRFQSRFLPSSPNRCPYDSLLRAVSRPLGWDWRILRAVMYQESKYRMNARSAAGAMGLMQMKESTARDMKVKDLYNPEDNVKGAVRYFAYLKRNMHLTHLPEEEEIHFVLAAYNAGMTRIQKDREQAATEGKNPDSWSEVAPYTPSQTQNYVETIKKRYLDWVTSSE